MGVQERRKRERAARRKEVLDAARRLVRERGFNGTTTKQIANACELSEATLFIHFQSKDEIFTSLLDEGIEYMRAGLEEIDASDASPRAKLQRLWRFFGNVERDHPEYFQVFTYLAHPQATANVSREVVSAFAQRSGENFRRLTSLLSGVPGISQPRLAADLLWGSFLGLIVLRDSRVNLGSRGHPTSRGLSAIFELLLEGIGPVDTEEAP